MTYKSNSESGPLNNSSGFRYYNDSFQKHKLLYLLRDYVHDTTENAVMVSDNLTNYPDRG